MYPVYCVDALSLGHLQVLSGVYSTKHVVFSLNKRLLQILQLCFDLPYLLPHLHIINTKGMPQLKSITGKTIQRKKLKCSNLDFQIFFFSMPYLLRTSLQHVDFVPGCFNTYDTFADDFCSCLLGCNTVFKVVLDCGIVSEMTATF
jgi:hypothetical protein